MSSSNRLDGLHNDVFNRQRVLNRVEFNHSGAWGNQRLVGEAARLIRGTVGDLRMSDEEIRTADSILSLAKNAPVR